MTALEEISKQLDSVTDKISTQVRSVSLGVLAVAWLFLSGNKDVPDLPALSPTAKSEQFIAIAALCILALVADLAQYLCGYWNALVALEAIRQSGATSATYPNDWRRKGRMFFFSAKSWLALIAAGWLIGLLAYAVWPRSG
ncbi:MAG TPA: hypothetical protein VHC92_05085 [Rhodanobacteraceae bacterium]|jgi:hypothetical protein|nr:hypothetical protein [Rhodanobacteraceae bacterium]